MVTPMTNNSNVSLSPELSQFLQSLFGQQEANQASLLEHQGFMNEQNNYMENFKAAAV